MYDALEVVNTDKVVAFVASLQQEDGSFYGDKWGMPSFIFCLFVNQSTSNCTGMCKNKIENIRYMSVSVPNTCLKTVGFRYYMYMYSFSSTPI